MHFALPAEGLAAAVLTDMGPSWFLTQAMSNYCWNNEQSAHKPPLRAVVSAGQGGTGQWHMWPWLRFIFPQKSEEPPTHPPRFSSSVIPSISAPKSRAHPPSQCESQGTGMYWEAQAKGSPGLACGFRNLLQHKCPSCTLRGIPLLPPPPHFSCLHHSATGACSCRNNAQDAENSGLKGLGVHGRTKPSAPAPSAAQPRRFLSAALALPQEPSPAPRPALSCPQLSPLLL